MEQRMTMPPEDGAQRLPLRPVLVAMPGDPSGEPAEIALLGRGGAAHLARARVAGVGVLAVAGDALSREEHGDRQAHFREERLVLVHAPEALFEAADRVHRLAPHEHAAGAGRARLVAE